jgi:ABC-type Fe2+-enterobactin transport system substrate-binding protein
MNMNINKKVEAHVYKVVHTLATPIDSVYPTVTMEIDEQASLPDHLYAFERFLQSVGFSLPENSHLDFVENESESRDNDDMIVIEGEHKNNGVN